MSKDWSVQKQTAAGVADDAIHDIRPEHRWRTVPKRRVLLIASAGGHWVQLARLSSAFEGHEALYATTLKGVQAPSGSKPVALLNDASRSSPIKFAMLVIQLFWLMLRFRPHVVVTTGAAPGLIAIQVGRIFGSRTVWIDSLANSERLSLSGELAERFADLWLTQWPHLTSRYPKLKSFGSVL